MGSLRTFSFAIDLSNVSRSEGNNKRLDSIASKRVPDTNAPRATVPPKSEAIKGYEPRGYAFESSDPLRIIILSVPSGSFESS